MENNKLIAEFMGFKIIQMSVNNNPIYNIPTTEGIGYVPKFMKYHKSWDWLMPVVDKIESLDGGNREYVYNFKQEQCFVEIIINDDSETIIEVDGDTKLEATYKAIIEFIKWYNKNVKEDDMDTRKCTEFKKLKSKD